jgi:competence protein ComEC
VLAVAAAGAAGPQLGWGPILVAVGGAFVAAALPGARPVLAAGAAILTVTAVAASGGRSPAEPIAAFLAVGQGDAALLRGPAGSTVLIDGGPDPATLRSALRRFGVSRIDLLIVSHRHADHVAGLVPLPAELPIGMIWAPPQAVADSLLASVLESASERGVPVLLPAPGDTAGIGPFRLEVIGPRRRYASPNDGSLVVLATAGATTVLFPGDIESIAQRELGPLPADVMKVPHQGAATSDLDWLADSAGALAIVSVGPNRFGHPSETVIAALRSAGSRVVRTDEHGDVVIRLGATP